MLNRSWCALIFSKGFQFNFVLLFPSVIYEKYQNWTHEIHLKNENENEVNSNFLENKGSGKTSIATHIKQM